MDNISTETPVGGEGATSSQDNVNVDTQTAEAPVAVSDSQEAEAGQATSPWDNDPKFKGKSPEDIYQAYKEAEKLTGQLSQKAQVANLIEQEYGLTPDKLKAQIEQMKAQERQERYANNPLAPLADEVSELKAKIAQQEQEKAHNAVKTELDSFLKDNQSYEPFKDKIYKLALTPNIGFNPETGEEVPFETLAQEYFGAARAQGQQDAYKKIEQKEMTQATGVSSVAKKQFSVDDLRNLSVAELEAILPHRKDY
jgi:hypothetical protein